jgi:hypothetical protein
VPIVLLDAGYAGRHGLTRCVRGDDHDFAALCDLCPDIAGFCHGQHGQRPQRREPRFLDQMHLLQCAQALAHVDGEGHAPVEGNALVVAPLLLRQRRRKEAQARLTVAAADGVEDELGVYFALQQHRPLRHLQGCGEPLLWREARRRRD